MVPGLLGLLGFLEAILCLRESLLHAKPRNPKPAKPGETWGRYPGFCDCLCGGAFLGLPPLRGASGNLGTSYPFSLLQGRGLARRRRAARHKRRYVGAGWGARKIGTASAEFGVRSAECGARSQRTGKKCGARSAECGVNGPEKKRAARSAELGVRSERQNGNGDGAHAKPQRRQDKQQRPAQT
jgi:hypothetical protein